MYLTIENGLPVRIFRATTKDGEEREFKVSTETVNRLISPIIENQDDTGVPYSELEEFDNQVMYYLPHNVFMFPKDEAVLKFINEAIDIDHYQL